MKDWIGNPRSTFTTLGASNHVEHERAEHDYYATEPRVIDELFAVESFDGVIWEPACGQGHLSKRMVELGKHVLSTDLVYRDYGTGGVDFLSQHPENPDVHIITNPPYRFAKEFVEHALEVISSGFKVAMFLKLTFLEGQNRRRMFDHSPPKTIYVYSSRRKCAINGDFESAGSSAACYAWFVWEKGCTGQPIIQWI